MRSVFCTAYIIKMAATVAMILFFIFLAISRVYLGEHSYNQVLFGSTLGITFAFILHFKIKPILKAVPLMLKSAYGIVMGSFNVPIWIFLLVLFATSIIPLLISGGIYWMKIDAHGGNTTGSPDID